MAKYQELMLLLHSETPSQRNIPKTESLLTHATHNIIHYIEPGSMSTLELGSIPGLMAAWTSKKKRTSKTNAEVAIILEQLLNRVIDERRAGNESARATTRMYTMTIDAWSKSGKRGYAAHRSQSILDSMEQMYREGDMHSKPDSYTYNAVLNAWSKSGEDDASARAQKILNRMTNDLFIKPDVCTYTTVIDSLKNGGRGSAHKALQLLNIMQNADNNVRPNAYTFTTIINVLAKSGDNDAGNKSLIIIEYMMDIYKNGDYDSRPNILTCNGVLGCLAKGSGKHTAAKIDEMLTRMKLPKEQNGFEVPPDGISYNIAILFYCRQKSIDSISHAISLLQLMKTENVSPTLNQYNAVIIALSKLQNGNSPKIADSVLQQMIKSFENGEVHAVQPDTISFNACMNAYSRCTGLDSARRAEELIIQMHNLHQSKAYVGLKPNARSFAAVLQAWARSGQRKTAAIRTEEIIYRMEQLHQLGELESPPDVYCYTIAIAAWANSGSFDAGQRAEQLLDRMDQMYERGYKNVKPNVRTYNAVIDTIYRSRKGSPENAEALLLKMIRHYESGDADLQPDTFSFNAAIQCFTKSRRPDAGDRAMALLQKMLSLHEKGVVEPDARSFSHVIEHYSKSSDKDAPTKAENLLKMMVNLYLQQAKNGKYSENLMPNLFSFTAVMMSYTRSHPNAGVHCEEILVLLNYLYTASNCNPKLKPNAFVYNCVLDAYSKSGKLRVSAQRAQEILSIMEQEYSNGRDDMRPTAKTYILTMICFAKSKEIGKARKTLNILRRMNQQYHNGNTLAQPNVQAYSILINAVAFTNHENFEEEKESLDIAKTAMKELQDCDFDEPNSITYGSFLKACGNLNLPKELLEHDARSSFLKCCEEGQVNEYVVSQLKNAVSNEMLEELIPNWYNLEYRKNRWNKGLPPHWSRNVPEKLLNETKGRWCSSSA